MYTPPDYNKYGSRPGSSPGVASATSPKAAAPKIAGLIIAIALIIGLFIGYKVIANRLHQTKLNKSDLLQINTCGTSLTDSAQCLSPSEKQAQ